MTLVTRSAIRLSKRGGQALRNTRANAALFNSAAAQASKVVSALGRVEPRVKLAAKPGECWA
jgi:F-type H+-transporting ATPase subunit beta